MDEKVYPAASRLAEAMSKASGSALEALTRLAAGNLSGLDGATRSLHNRRRVRDRAARLLRDRIDMDRSMVRVGGRGWRSMDDACASLLVRALPRSTPYHLDRGRALEALADRDALVARAIDVLSDEDRSMVIDHVYGRIDAIMDRVKRDVDDELDELDELDGIGPNSET